MSDPVPGNERLQHELDELERDDPAVAAAAASYDAMRDKIIAGYPVPGNQEPRAFPNAPLSLRLPSDWGYWSSSPALHDGDEWQADYEVLRDTIIAAFNPSDGDVAELSIMTTAIDHAWGFIVAQPCRCEPDAGDWSDPCDRCRVLGRIRDDRLEW